MPADIGSIVDDLRAEHAELDAVLAGLPDQDWDIPTLAEPWSVRDQVSHLSFFDDRAALSATDPRAFAADLAVLLEDVDAFMNRPLEEGRRLTPIAVLARWRTQRERLCSALLAVDPAARLPWYGPAMSVASFATARLMETWAHGQDVVDALGVDRAPTVRLRHVAHIAVKARPFNYLSNNLTLPDSPVHVALIAPDGATWAWEDPALPDRITGSAHDFCLVATQRRHLDDTALEVTGRLAREWIGIAQAFAGPPGPGRRPGQLATRGAAAA